MSRSILSGFGPEMSEGGNRASSGGVTQAKQERYSPPVGPKHQFNPGPGLRGGTTFGQDGSQGKRALRAEASGSPGLKAENRGSGGSQHG